MRCMKLQDLPDLSSRSGTVTAHPEEGCKCTELYEGSYYSGSNRKHAAFLCHYNGCNQRNDGKYSKTGKQVAPRVYPGRHFVKQHLYTLCNEKMWDN
jgi:hypothetical protein